MAKYLGTIILLIGAILLIVEGVIKISNVILATGLFLVIAGYLVHIFLGRKLATS